MIELPVALTVAFILLLIVISAFFSASESGLTAASRVKIFHLKSEGNKRAKIVTHLRENKEKMIGAILLGNNTVNIAASALATALAIQLVGEEGVIYATIAMTLLVLIFAEVLPKSFALQNAETVALFCAPILKWMIRLFHPIVAAVEFIVSGLLRAMGLHKLSDGDAELSGAEALRGAIQMHHEDGIVLKRDRDMLDSIIHLSEAEVEEAMIHRRKMMMLDADLPPEELIKGALEIAHSRIPLWKDNADNIVGILLVKDLLQLLEAQDWAIEKVDISSVIKEPWFVPESTLLMNQLHAFRERQQHFALVVDEYGTLLGLITLEDILEEIVGQIEDEFDAGRKSIRRQKDKSYNVDGSVTVRDLNRALDWDLPDDVATTVAGLVIHKAKQIPAKTQTFHFYGYRFEILRKKRNQITSLNIRKVEGQG